MRADIQKIWEIFTPDEHRRVRWMLLLAVFMAVVETVSVISIIPFMSVLSRPGIIEENSWLKFLFERSELRNAREFIVALGAVSILLVITSSLLKLLIQHGLNRFIHLARYSISARLLERYLNQPYEFFLSRNSAQLSKNILSEVDQLLFNLLQPLSQMLAQSVVVLAMATVIVLYDPKIAFYMIATIGMMYIVIYGAVRKKLGKIGQELVSANGERYKSGSEALGGVKDVKITHSVAAYLSKFKTSARLYSRNFAASDTLSLVPQYMVEAVAYSGLILVALILLWRTNDTAHVMPALGLYGFAGYRMLPAAQIIYRGFARLKFSSAALKSIHCDLMLPGEQLIDCKEIWIPRKEIRLESISYAYPSSPEKLVLSAFNLTIPVNTTVGIVGQSGAGKSTVMDLMLGLLRPQAGAMSIDGVTVTGDSIAAWQRAIGYVPQHVYLADTSVAENIAFGVSSNEIDMNAVERAARAAQLHDFIVTTLPVGYQTALGERGIRLSGGQRQRIGIARALYRDPPVLFMDEATSALDSQTEAAVNEAIRSLSGRKTIIVIAHKESSLQHCQKIVVIPS